MKLEEIKPIRGYLLIEPSETEVQQKAKNSGIILADIVQADVPQSGKVIAVGDDLLTDYGAIVPSPVKKDQNIIYKKWGGNEIKLEDRSYYFVRFDDVLGTC